MKLFWKKDKDFKALDEAITNIIEPDRFSLVKHDSEEGWVEISKLDKCPTSATSADLTGFSLRAGDRIRIYDQKTGKVVRSYTFPGKTSEPRSSEKKSALGEISGKLGEAVEEIKGVTSVVGELQSALVVPTNGITKQDLKELIEELRKPQQGDLKSQLAIVREFINDLRGIDQDLKIISGIEKPAIPPEVFEKIPGGLLPLYYPPTAAIQEIKQAGKEIAEHAIKTAKGETTSSAPDEEKILEGFRGEGESVLERLKRKKQQQTAGG